MGLRKMPGKDKKEGGKAKENPFLCAARTIMLCDQASRRRDCCAGFPEEKGGLYDVAKRGRWTEFMGIKALQAFS